MRWRKVVVVVIEEEEGRKHTCSLSLPPLCNVEEKFKEKKGVKRDGGRSEKCPTPPSPFSLPKHHPLTINTGTRTHTLSLTHAHTGLKAKD